MVHVHKGACAYALPMLSLRSGVTVDPNQRVLLYCAEFSRRAHGVPVGSWIKLLAAARNGTLRAESEWDEAAAELPSSQLHDSLETASAKEQTIEWWIIWLTLEDQCPNETAIVHRVVVWDAVHELEYKPDMWCFFTTKALSRSRWLSLRVEALVWLSIDWFGEDTLGKPNSMLRLVERASHSNFASCHTCADIKIRWVAFRTAPRGTMMHVDPRVFKEELHVHIREVKAQRMKTMALTQECASTRGWSAEYDDGCGSGFMHAPNVGVREDGAVATRWKYRFGMQCNLIPGGVLRTSLILPCVIKVRTRLGDVCVWCVRAVRVCVCLLARV
jgi:hypothetical protein